jgi:hypothetical protein
VEHIVGSVGAAAIDVFGIDVARLHWDMTSISLCGAYDQVDGDHPAPAYGHPKDRRTDLKQIQAGIAVTTDGGIPLFRVTAHLTTSITTTPEGTPVFAWSFDQAAIDAEAAGDGWYALLTNLDADIDAAEVFHRYKDQPVVERRRPPRPTTQIPKPGYLQAQLLDLLHVDPTEPRWP